jgi:hypothetical protein
MPLLIKIDEDLPVSVAGPLVRQGHQVRTVLGQGWGGLKDPVLWPKVVEEGALFVTADKGFGDLRSFPPGTHAGIVVLRPDKESVLEFVRLIEQLITRYSLPDLQGFITVVGSHSIRIRRKPL